MANLTNAQMWDAAQRYNASYSTQTAKGTAEKFTAKGWEAVKPSDNRSVNEFFDLTLRMVLNLINVSRAKNPLDDSGIFAKFEQPEAAIAQRMAINAVKPMTPAYSGLSDGDSVDPFVVSTPDVSERWLTQNFDFQAGITIQEYQVKTVFASEYGMDLFTGGIVDQLGQAYTEQEYVNALEVIHKALTSTTWTLKDTQQYSVPTWTDGNPTDSDLRGLIKTLLNLVETMKSLPRTDMFNSYGFKTVADPAEHVLLLRGGILPAMMTETLYAAFHDNYLTSPMEIRVVKDFGGLEYYQEAGLTTRVYPQYDTLGRETGFGTTQGGSNPTVTDPYVKDPHANILGVICQKGMIPIIEQNAFQIIPIMNPRGLYTNYWASRPNTGINYDPAYNLITITKPN